DRWHATGTLEVAVRRAPDRTSRGHHGAARPRRRDFASHARIMATTVILLFAVALADRNGDTALAERARAAYLALPGQPTSRITREMTRQLGLARHPSGAAAQQGLHYSGRSGARRRTARCPCNPHRAPRTTL